MRILHIFNRYRENVGGEVSVYESLTDILKRGGHEILPFEKQSTDIDSASRKAMAFASSIYSIAARREIREVIRDWRPDLAHVHNIYPLLSPSILLELAEQNVPVVMSIHNFWLTCPARFHVHKLRYCDQCVGGREFWCAIRNCGQNPIKSLNFALRSASGRFSGVFERAVSLFISPSVFAQQQLDRGGISQLRIRVAPHTVPIPKEPANPAQGVNVIFAGRLEPEKGIANLISAATFVPDIPFMIAGEGSIGASLARSAPTNVTFAGKLAREDLARLYAHARLAVVPSLVAETFGLAAAEPMAHGLPVIAARIGALPEIVEDGLHGYLYNSEDPLQLADKIRQLWCNPTNCVEMGIAARAKTISEYSENLFLRRIENVYTEAMLTGATGSQASNSPNSN